MSNSWTDIGNASLVVVMGANPSENHPACMAHINHARDKGGKLIVIDPRKTRTALQADKFIRIRPGTDIAFVNGVVKGIIDAMEQVPGSVATTDDQREQFFKFLNQKGGVDFYSDGTSGSGSTIVNVPNNSKYTDACFVVDMDSSPAGQDYKRHTIVAATGLPYSGTEDPADPGYVAPSGRISNFPVKVATVTADDDTVYMRLKAHVAPYTQEMVKDICRCTEADVDYMVKEWIDNSRCSSAGDTLAAQNPNPIAGGYKATTHLYAMGLTQHTHGAQNVKSFAVLQSLMGNMGRAGGGINALRGIHNVQGSTDMGVLQHLIPFYSGNPTQMTGKNGAGTYPPPAGSTGTNDANAFGIYMDDLWGRPVNGSGNRTNMNNTYDDAYNTDSLDLQQRGFLNMTYDFFGGGAMGTGNWRTEFTAGTIVDREKTDALYDLWPKTNGDNHISMFRKMAAGDITACIVWAQNPAVTEPNQLWIREGFKQLKTLVVVDMFENETAAVERNLDPDTVTYLIPACSHAEEAGSVANSGRVLQWRERAAVPAGNSKADLELLFRLAFAFDKAGAFSHLTAAWAGSTLNKPGLNAYDVLYYNRYGYKPGVSDAFETLKGMAEVWRGADPGPMPDRTAGSQAGLVEVEGSEWIAEQIYRNLCTPATGSSWLYVAAYSGDRTTWKHASQADWQTANRAKSRSMLDPNNTLAYPGWGYSWLVNRRVLYNNGDVPGDIGDAYMGPDSVSRLYVTHTALKGRQLNYPARKYRFYHRLNDLPDVAGIHGPLAARFPSHTEPYETPLALTGGDPEGLLPKFGRNTTRAAAYDLGGSGVGTAWNLVPNTTRVAGKNEPADGFPLVLTTIRCVEHFQGGPITRNNPWNVEAEPEPWIEINSVDALRYGITTGQWINVITARGDSTSAGQKALSPNSGDTSQGFRARVGVGAEDNQRVGVGVVAIPWHWGDRGLSTGARANDLCIDAGDANTLIPEYKACLCQIAVIPGGGGE